MKICQPSRPFLFTSYKIKKLAATAVALKLDLAFTEESAGGR